MPLNSPLPAPYAEPPVACHDCDLLLRVPSLAPGQNAVCPRCGAVLLRGHAHGVDRGLALVVAGFILFALANLFPFLALNARGQIQETSLITGAVALWNADHVLLGGLVLLTTFVLPLVDLLGMLLLLIGVKMRNLPRGAASVFRFLRSAQPWGMLEIFLLGVLVAGVKLGDLATVIPGPAAYSFVALIVVLATLSLTLDPHEIWQRLEPPKTRP
ncbi:MAG: paraquat-inducible protein A [Thiotrichales bacterium]